MNFIKTLLALTFVIISGTAMAKDYKIISTGSVGASVDAQARVIAKYMVKYLPEGSSVVVQNMPGNAIQIRHIAEIAPKDGTTFGILSTSGIIQSVAIEPPVKMSDIQWLGSFETNTVPVIWKKRGTTEPILAANTASKVHPLILFNAVSKSSIKNVITGFKNNAEIVLAMERGEVDGLYRGTDSVTEISPQWLEPNGPVEPWIVLRKVRSSRFPNVKTMYEFEAKQPYQKEMLDLIDLTLSTPDSLAAPVGADMSAVKVALTKTVKDAEFLVELRKLGDVTGFIDGRKISENANKMETIVRANLDKLR